MRRGLFAPSGWFRLQQAGGGNFLRRRMAGLHATQHAFPYEGKVGPKGSDEVDKLHILPTAIIRRFPPHQSLRDSFPPKGKPCDAAAPSLLLCSACITLSPKTQNAALSAIREISKEDPIV